MVSVSDGVSSVNLPSFNIDVSNTNRAPSINGLPSLSLSENMPYSFIPVATDVDEDSLTFSIANRPSWADFDAATGALTGTPSFTDSGEYSAIVISASDGVSSVNLPSFNIEVSNTNRAPSISGLPTLSLAESMPYSFIPVATDADEDSLTFSITNKPSWADFDAATGVLTGTPSFTDSGEYSAIVVSVSDGVSSVSLPSFNIAVSNTNRAPSISGLPTLSLAENMPYSFIPVATDADQDSLRFSITNKPNWADFDVATGALTGTPSFTDSGEYSAIVVSVSDGVISVSLPSFNIEVSNTNRAPSISGLPAQTVVENTVYLFIPTASDPDGDNLIFTVTNKPSWADFDPTTGALTGLAIYLEDGGLLLTQISVSDGAGEVDLADFFIQVLPDLDGDTIPDTIDTDDDGDGIPDDEEGLGDYDNDGIPDYQDLDVDGDGLPDSEEGVTDDDNDGIPNYLDTSDDEDGDGIEDVLEGLGDADGDGVGNAFDTDSDNDGIPDSVEYRRTVSGQGRDSDGDGALDYLDRDSDNDGLPDAMETQQDSDGDGQADYLDLDSDNDGIHDRAEAGLFSIDNRMDTDNDGIIDLFDVDITEGNDIDQNGIDDLVGLLDSDQDGVPNYRDLDSDNDGVFDIVEAGMNDLNNDGLLDAVLTPVLILRDIDQDSIPDFLDLDSDNNGVFDIAGSPSAVFDLNGDGRIDITSDTDSDGIDDSVDGEPRGPGGRVYQGFPPQAGDDLVDVKEGASIIFDARINDSDQEVESSSLVVIIVTEPGNGQLLLSGEGVFTYIHDGSESMNDRFTYLVSDSIFESNQATVTINIEPANDAPVALSQSLSTTDSVMLEFDLNATDSDDTDLFYVINEQPSYGLLGQEGRRVLYTPDPGFLGVDTFTFYVSDGEATSDVVSVKIAVLTDVDTDGVGDIFDTDVGNNGIPDELEEGTADDETVEVTPVKTEPKHKRGLGALDRSWLLVLLALVFMCRPKALAQRTLCARA